jgi:hypothetical protein
MSSVGVEFGWDSHNRNHVPRHRVTPDEAEQALALRVVKAYPMTPRQEEFYFRKR